MDGRYISYLRVSTAKQKASGLGVEAQRAVVETYLNGGSWTLLAEFVETESGKHNDRVQLAAAMKMCRMTGSTLVIAKLDRLSRNAAFLIGLKDAGVDFVAADMPNANKLTVGIMALVAEQERDAISRRTRDALAAAKARGTVLGGWKGSDNRGDLAVARAALAKQTAAFTADVAPIVREQHREGRSLRQIALYLESRGIRTPRGGDWTAMAIKRLLDRTKD
jgi:DNA invertase Pin-like site-specific DNA recombinase